MRCKKGAREGWKRNGREARDREGGNIMGFWFLIGMAACQQIETMRTMHAKAELTDMRTDKDTDRDGDQLTSEERGR